MIDFNKIEEFLNSEPDLPISEELLGAYLEGNTSNSERSDVESYINNVPSFGTFISDFNTSKDEISEDNVANIDSEVIDLDNNPLLINEYEKFEQMKEYNRSYNVYGESGENVSDPVYIQQPDDHSCALRSQQIVLRDFGIDIPFDELEKLALSNGVYSENGTYTYDIGKVLQLAGVGMHQVQGSSLYDLTNELAQGHRVIVSVDADELWYDDPLNKLKNWFNDAIGNQCGNHALIVAGVEVNPDDAADVKVVLTDPGAGHLRVEYPLDKFMDAWNDSKCFMAATDAPAPYQYDAETGKEVPSNFMVQQVVNDFVASNSYQLSPDMVNMPQDYVPAYTGHLDKVGDMDYDTFEDRYNSMIDNRMPSSLSIKEQIEELAKSKNDLSQKHHAPDNNDDDKNDGDSHNDPTPDDLSDDDTNDSSLEPDDDENDYDDDSDDDSDDSDDSDDDSGDEFDDDDN
jgi:hypothetical protein